MKISEIKDPTIVLHTKTHKLTKTYNEEEFQTLVSLSLFYTQSLYAAIQDAFFSLLDSEPFHCQLNILSFEFIYKDTEGFRHVIAGNL